MERQGGRQARFAIRNLGMFHSFSHAQVAGRYYNPSHSTRKNCVIKGAGGKGTQVNRSLFSLCYSSGCGPLFFVHTHHYTLIIGCVGLIGLTRRGVKRPLHFLGNKKARPLSWGEKYFSFRIFYHKIRFTDHFL